MREHLAAQPVAPQTQADTHVAAPKARPPWPVVAMAGGLAVLLAAVFDVLILGAQRLATPWQRAQPA